MRFGDIRLLLDGEFKFAHGALLFSPFIGLNQLLPFGEVLVLSAAREAENGKSEDKAEVAQRTDSVFHLMSSV